MSIAPGGPRHRMDSIHVDTDELTSELCDALTARVVASLAGVKDPGQVRKWAAGRLVPTQPAQQRLRFAYDRLHEIERSQGRKTAQAWMITINPRLDHESPVKAIREDRFRETAAAAQALLDEGYDG